MARMRPIRLPHASFEDEELVDKWIVGERNETFRRPAARGGGAAEETTATRTGREDTRGTARVDDSGRISGEGMTRASDSTGVAAPHQSL